MSNSTEGRDTLVCSIDCPHENLDAQGRCRPCRNTNEREKRLQRNPDLRVYTHGRVGKQWRHHRRMINLMDAFTYLGGSRCRDCGYDQNLDALEFDHVHGVKKANIAQLLHLTWANLVDELDKCEVVCANCHRIRTQERIRSAP